MNTSIGKRKWAIAEGYIPESSHGPEPDMTSHETACILNTSDEPAHVKLTVFFDNEDAIGPYCLTIPGRRTRHVRFNNLDDPKPIPKGVDFATLIESDVPIVVQHTRLDSQQKENALMTTVAYCEE